MPNQAPDLTKQAPRSPRVRLGGYGALPRALDKGRATLAGTNGEYHYNCPLDQAVFEFIGIDADALKAELATGKGDGEILQWIKANATNKRADHEIAAWTAYRETRAPYDLDGREYFNEAMRKFAPEREDVVTWVDLLDLDDYVSFGGKA
jgi:hypothetical protein